MILLIAILLLGASGPSYTPVSIVGAADNQASSLAPNTIATIYGTGLAYDTAALSAEDLRGTIMPTVLPGTGVHVLVGGLLANLYYVSPSQINFLIPPMLLAGPSNVQVVLAGIAGPLIPVNLSAVAPALFQLDAQTVTATGADGSLLNSDRPARPGDIVILYATGLGQTQPAIIYSVLPSTAAPITQLAKFKILLDGVAIDSANVLYAGVAPGFAGLYQINARLPDYTGANPELRIALGDSLSVGALSLPVRQ